MEIYNLQMVKNIEGNGDQDISMVKVYLLINLDLQEEVFGNSENIRFDCFMLFILFYYNHIF